MQANTIQIDKFSPVLLRVNLCIMKAALVKLDDCRAKCPGIGGDVDAMNLRGMIRDGNPIDSAIKQAADCLERLSASLDIEAKAEVTALRFAAGIY